MIFPLGLWIASFAGLTLKFPTPATPAFASISPDDPDEFDGFEYEDPVAEAEAEIMDMALAGRAKGAGDTRPEETPYALLRLVLAAW